MKKIFFLVFLFLAIPIIGIGQTIGTPPECTTSEAPPNSVEMENIRSADFSGYDYYLKVYVHVLSHSQTGSGQTNMGINESMRRLYDVYDDLGIYLVWDGEVDYIENNTWFDDPQSNKNNILNYNYHTDGIDIYIGSSLNPYAVGEAGGDIGIGEKSSLIVSGYTDYQGINVFDFWPQSPVIVHEMGHVLYLWHTFHGTRPGTGGCPECLSPNTQGQCGDYVADTQPDPGVNINSACNYTGGAPNECDNDFTFTPPTNNFMTTGSFDCWNNFTQGQKLRMKNAISLLPVLQSTQLQEYTYVRGSSLVCDSSVYEIYSDDTSSLTIESSDNIDVTITPINNTQINITIENPYPFEPVGHPAWISVKNNGVEQARKDIWIGKPQAVEAGSIFGATPVTPGDVEDYAILTQLEGTFTEKGEKSYEWMLPGHEIEETDNFTEPFQKWKYNYLTKHNFVAQTQIGGCSGEIKLYGINDCGSELTLDDGDGFEVYVINEIPPCPNDGIGIVYYPNPADDLLNIDLSLQNYKVFDIVVYNNSQIAVYTDQSTNVVKTIDTFNLNNGNYFLHIYDGNELILSKILIINH